MLKLCNLFPILLITSQLPLDNSPAQAQDSSMSQYVLTNGQRQLEPLNNYQPKSWKDAYNHQAEH